MAERVQLPVRDDAELAGELPDLGDAEPDGLDHAGVRADLDDVADRDQVLEEDEESHHDVADEALRPEADRDADHPGRHQERPHVDADLLQDHDDDEEGHEVAGGARQQRAQGLGALGAGRVVRRARRAAGGSGGSGLSAGDSPPSRRAPCPRSPRSGRARGPRPPPATASAPPGATARRGATGTSASGHAAPSVRGGALPRARGPGGSGAPEPANVPHRLQRDEVGGYAQDEAHDGRPHEERLRGDEEHAPHELPEVVGVSRGGRRGGTAPADSASPWTLAKEKPLQSPVSTASPKARQKPYTKGANQGRFSQAPVIVAALLSRNT